MQGLLAFGVQGLLAFKSAFQKKELARDFFRNYLPENVVRHTDFSHLELVNKSYVDEKLKEKHSDIVYKTKIMGKEAVLYVLFEHQSKSDFRMVFRLLCYMTNIWKEYLDQNPKAEKLPVIIPVVFYHGKTGWRAARHFVGLVGNGELFPDYIPDFTYELIDLGKYGDEELIGDLSLKLVLRTFKHICDGDAEAVWRMTGDLLTELGNHPSFPELLEWSLRYFYHARTEEKERLEEIIDRTINELDSKGAKKMAMSVADQFREEGLQKGLQEGLQKGIRKTASNLLKMGMDVGFVSQATGLTEEEIRQLKKTATDTPA